MLGDGKNSWRLSTVRLHRFLWMNQSAGWRPRKTDTAGNPEKMLLQDIRKWVPLPHASQCMVARHGSTWTFAEFDDGDVHAQAKERMFMKCTDVVLWVPCPLDMGPQRGKHET